MILFISFLPVLAVLISLNFLWQGWSPISSVPWFSKTVAPTRSSSQNLTKRYFYTRTTTKARLVKAPVVLPKEHEDSKLSPYFITGFSDGEACFYIAVVQSKTHSQGWEVKPSFIIKLHAKDKPVLVEIKKFIGVGRITQQRPNAVQLRVFLLKELEGVINHFDLYPLLTQKRADYQFFKKFFKIMKLKEHITPEGLRKIVALKAAINWGLSEKLQLAFPDVVPVERPNVELPKTIHPEWLAGFTSAEGSFMIKILQSQNRVGYQVILVFVITQHSRDEELLIAIMDYLGCGYIQKKGEAFDLRVTKISDIEKKIISHFKKYPIRGVKAQDFQDWVRAAELMKQKKHLTADGIEKIKQIKAGMNRGRNI